MKPYLIVFLGGGIGAAGRYWLSSAVYKVFPPEFPFGNLVVNVSGCLLIGMLMSVTEGRLVLTSSMKMFLAIGILGGFTTFSSFSYETIALLRDGQILYGSLNVLATILGCLAATYAGMVIGKII
ncbi:MAG: putative fluoride ion transporter CrcB [Bacteroidia bacterium]|nr:MAG: putative fluoride ion transporter CrcB [Bacteroidia bacterium]